MRTPRWSALTLLLLSAPLLLGADGEGCAGDVIIGSGGDEPATPATPTQPSEVVSPLVTPCTAELHSFSSYDAGGQAVVEIERPGNHVVVLSAYEETSWVLAAATGANIELVILNGFKQQTVFVPAGVQVVDYSGADRYLGDPAPTDWPATNGSIIEFVGAVQQISGQRLTTFIGCGGSEYFLLRDDLTSISACASNGPNDVYFIDEGSVAACASGVTTDLPGNVHPSACSDDLGYMFGFGYNCETMEVFALASSGELSCRDLHAACAQYAADNPGASVACRFGFGEIFVVEQTPGACDLPQPPGGGCEGKSGLGGYWFGPCGSGNVGPTTSGTSTSGISCLDALENCWINAMMNPQGSFECYWNGTPLYEQESVPGECSALP